MEFRTSEGLTTDGISLRGFGAAESRSTFANTYMSATTAFSIFLLSSEWAAGALVCKLPIAQTIEVRELNKPSGQTIVPNDVVSSQVLVSALIQFHDQIVSSQEDLPPEALEVLHKHLWELYG